MKSKIETALQHQLYEPDFFFYELFTEFPEYIKDIEVIENKAVAVVFNYPEEYEIEGEHIGCYTKPEFRHQGYGRRAVQAVGGIRNREWRIGKEGSGYFWTNIEEEEQELLC